MSSSRGSPGSAGGARAELPEAFTKEVARIQETGTDLLHRQAGNKYLDPGFWPCSMAWPKQREFGPTKSRGGARAGRSWAEQKDGVRGMARSCKSTGSRGLSTWHL